MARQSGEVLRRLMRHFRVSPISSRGLSVAGESTSNVAGLEGLKLEVGSADAAEILRARKKVDPKILLRRQYDRTLSELRKQYAEAEAVKKRKEEKKNRAAELQVMLERSQRAALREERSRVRALQAEEENKTSLAAREEDRAQRAERRIFREKQFARKEGKKSAALRQQSAVWVEEQELERRILEAMADPRVL